MFIFSVYAKIQLIVYHKPGIINILYKKRFFSLHAFAHLINNTIPDPFL